MENRVRTSLCFAIVFWAFFCVECSNIDVVIVPHSHCDVGWQKSVQGYFDEDVHQIIDQVVDALTSDSSKRFIWVETAFLQMWWDVSSLERQGLLVSLIQNGQLELVLGGIVMHDEACVHFVDAIDQMTEGHVWLRDTLQTLPDELMPRLAWHIDPFGSSSYSPTLWAGFCFDAFVNNRIDYQVKEEMFETKGLEFIWEGSPNLGEKMSTWTHVLDHHYSSPPRCDFEGNSTLNPPITPENVYNLSFQLADVLRERASIVQGSTIIVPFGDDFHFKNASLMFDNMGKLMNFINANESFGMSLRYGTLREAISAIHQQALKYPKLTNDFFPYDPSKQQWWTGFYTSWPQFKQAARRTSAFARSVDSLIVLAGGSAPQNIDDMISLRRSVGIVQHHDSITGTSPPGPRLNYLEMLSNGTRDVTPLATDLIARIVQRGGDLANFSLEMDSIDKFFDEGKIAIVAAFNSLGWERDDWICVECRSRPKTSIVVSDFKQDISVQSFFYDNSVKVCWFAEIPAFGQRSFALRVVAHLHENEDDAGPREVGTDLLSNGSVNIENEYYRLRFDNDTGRLSHMEALKRPVAECGAADELQTMISQIFNQYLAADNAYVFQTNGTVPPKPIQNAVIRSITNDPSLPIQEITLEFNDWLKQRIVLRKNSPIIDVYLTTGPIPFDSEIVMTISTDLDTDRVVYTDEMGVEMRQRQYNVSHTMEGQYHPVTSMAFIRDPVRKAQLTMLTDHALGVAATTSGSMDVLLHRSSSSAPSVDAHGNPIVWMNDTDVMEHHLSFMFGDMESTDVSRVWQSWRHNNPPMLAFAEAADASSWQAMHRPWSTLLHKPLPPQLALVSLRRRSSADSIYHLRLMHAFESSAACGFGNPAEVDLGEYFFGSFALSSVEERTLSDLYKVSDCSRMSWNAKLLHDSHSDIFRANDEDISFSPTQIRTYRVTFDFSSHSTSKRDWTKLIAIIVGCVGGLIVVCLVLLVAVSATAAFVQSRTTVLRGTATSDEQQPLNVAEDDKFARYDDEGYDSI